MPSSISNSDHDFVRPIPAVSWKAILTAVVVLSVAATVGWEIYARSKGYGPTLNDTADLWSQQRNRVQPDSVVLIGTSRMLFDADLDALQSALGKRPIQLALVGSSPFPVLADLATDTTFKGTVIVDIVPAMFLAPPGSPPFENSVKALKRRREWNYAQKWSHRLGMLLEEHVAFLKQEDLTMAQLINRVPIKDRAGALVAPPLPPYFYTTDRERRGRMFPPTAVIGSPLQQKVANTWLPLFSPPPPPTYIPIEKFGAMMGQAIEQRFVDTKKHVATLRARGAKVVFVRLPVSGPLAAFEEKSLPLVVGWGRLVKDSGVPGINFSDHPELAGFNCPEYSHLTAADSVEFSKRLGPHLQKALQDTKPAGAKSDAAGSP